MNGTAIMQGVAVVFAAQAFGIDLNASQLVTVVVTATVASIGTAGVPGVGTIMLTMVFASVGLPVEGVAMIMGIDRILDMGRTAINITGDAVCTTALANMVGMLNRDVFRDDTIKEVDTSTLANRAPADYSDFTTPEEGDTEIGEDGDFDMFDDLEYPEAPARK